MWERACGHRAGACGYLFGSRMVWSGPAAGVAGVAGNIALGGNLAGWIASALAFAVGASVMLPQVLLEIDDGDSPATPPPP